MNARASETSQRPAWMHLARLGLVSLAVALSYHAFFLRTFASWWVDDDPRNYGFIRGVANPLRLFVDPALAHSFSGTPTVNPMLGVSLWLDSTLAYRSLLFAELHNVLLLAATIALLFLVMRKWGLSLSLVCVAILLWLFFPATVLVSGWLAARHHLEGIIWSLGAILVAQKIVRGEWREDGRSIALLLFLLGGAALFKETFAITIPVGVGLYLWERERNRAAFSCAALIFFYAAYRCCMVGFTARYDIPLLGPKDFVQFLTRLPHILAGNAGGYALLVIALVPIVLMYRRGELRWRAIFHVVVVIAFSLAVVYPGAFALNVHWLEPNTWLRVVLLLQTGLLVGTALLVARIRHPSFNVVAAAVAIPIVIAGGFVTEQNWAVVRARYAAEGKYYLKHPDRLLYSEVPASWYLDGIQMLYDIPLRHHVTAQDKPNSLARSLAGHKEIWRYSRGKFLRDRELFAALSAQAAGSRPPP